MLVVLLALVVVAGFVVGGQAVVSQKYTVQFETELRMTKLKEVYPTGEGIVSVSKSSLTDYLIPGRSVPYTAEAGYADVFANMTIGNKMYIVETKYDWPKESEFENWPEMSSPLKVRFVGIESLGPATLTLTLVVHNQKVSNQDPTVIWWVNKTYMLRYSFDAMEVYELDAPQSLVATYME